MFLIVGLPEDFHSKDYKVSSDPPCIIEKLCSLHYGLVLEAKGIKEHFWKPYIRKLFDKKVGQEICNVEKFLLTCYLQSFCKAWNIYPVFLTLYLTVCLTAFERKRWKSDWLSRSWELWRQLVSHNARGLLCTSGPLKCDTMALTLLSTSYWEYGLAGLCIY